MVMYLCIALWLVCFYDAIIALCLPSSVQFIIGTDGSTARYISDLMAMSIGLVVLHSYGWEKLPKKSIGILLLLLIVSHFHSPNIRFDSVFLPPDHAVFNYKPMFEAILMFMMFMGLYSIQISDKCKRRVIDSFIWIATIYGSFAILQRFGLDQIYQLANTDTNHFSRNPEVGGFISQPVFCAALIAICIPFVFRHGKWWQALLSIGGILATGNRSALIVVVICAFYASKYRDIGKVLLAGYVSYLILGTVIQFFPQMHLPFMGEERFVIWSQILKDFVHSAFPGINNSHILTGSGLGSFAVIFPFYNHNGYYQAHNEFLEAARCIGVVGFGFMVYVIGEIPCAGLFTNAMLASCILALTNAIWHIPQLAFLTVFIVGLSYNKTMRSDYVETR